jgi:uncharacterized protein with ATP-grasp and redox domains
MRQALSAARLVTDDASFHHRCLIETAGILKRSRREMTPPELGEDIYRMVRELSGNPDPFREQKKRQNDAVMPLLPWLRETVASADDPLLMAVRLAIAGNAVDTGAQESFDLERSVAAAVRDEASLEDYPVLSERIEGARTVLIVADNCGEILFDQVLIETIKGASEAEVILAVRGGPIINDVTELEARELGLDRLCTVIPTGMEMPGTLIARTTPGFRKAFREADAVLSKGQGNWETLDECDREVFFLLQAKCEAVAAINRCEPGSSLLLRK